MADGDVFSLVQQFDKMRQGLGSGGGGVGRPMEAPKVMAAQWQQQRQQLPYQGHEMQTLPAPKAGGLVEWGGHKFDADALPHFQQLAQRFPGLRLTSGYRDPEHNAAVNGVKNSYHLTGRAADFAGSAREMQEAAAWAKTNGGRTLIHNAGSGQHLHVSWG